MTRDYLTKGVSNDLRTRDERSVSRRWCPCLVPSDSWGDSCKLSPETPPEGLATCNCGRVRIVDGGDAIYGTEGEDLPFSPPRTMNGMTPMGKDRRGGVHPLFCFNCLGSLVLYLVEAYSLGTSLA